MVLVWAAAWASAIRADPPLRLATYHSDAARPGPGLLLHAIVQGKDPQLQALAQVVALLDADVLLLHDIDLDAGGATAAALGRFLAQNGAPYAHILAPMPNAGVPSGLDLNGDGRLGRANDALGYGAFRGQGGMVLLSRLPIISEELIDFTGLLWRDLPGASLPKRSDGTAFPSAAALEVQPLSAVGAWAVPLRLPGGAGRLWVMAFHASPPVFDGPEDRNGRRNADELHLWAQALDGTLAPALPGQYFALMGVTNIDPLLGEGRRDGLQRLAQHPRLHPDAQSPHLGLPTVDWSGLGLGLRQASRIFPARSLQVRGGGVMWPAPQSPKAAIFTKASRHRPVWLDIAIPPAPQAMPPPQVVQN